MTSILPHCDQKKCLKLFQFFFNLPRLDLWSSVWSILENVQCALERKAKCAVLRWNILQISIRSNWSIVSFKVHVSLLIFCLVYLSIGVSRVLKSPTIIMLLLISPFILVSICLIYWGDPMLGAYIFIIVISSFWIDPLIIMYYPSLCLSWPLFQSLFYLIWVLILLLSFGLHLHEISFSIPSLSVYMCPLVWGGSLVDCIYRGLVFVSIHPVFVFWLGTFNPFTFKVTIDKYDPIGIYFVVLGFSL